MSFACQSARVLALVSFAAIAHADITWEVTFEAAMARAAAENRVVFLAVNMDGERANDVLAEDTYGEKSIGLLAGSTVNIVASQFDHGSGRKPCSRFGSITCEQHRRVEADARKTVLKAGADGRVVAPQHLFLTPKGDVILSVPYAIGRGELEWCFVTAIRKLVPESTIAMPSGARAPGRLIMEGVVSGEAAIRPLDEAELEAVLRELKRGFGALSSQTGFHRLLVTDDPDAVKYARTELTTGYYSQMAETLKRTVRRIGSSSPPAFWEAMAPLLESKSEDVRSEAAVALEQLAAKDSLRAIKGALAREKSAFVRKNLVRALGTAGAGNAGVRKRLLKIARSPKEPLARTSALIGLGAHAGDRSALEVLEAALESGSAEERQAVALGLAFARRVERREMLVAAAGREQDAEVKAVLARALSVLDGKNLDVLAADFRDVAHDRIPRGRFFGVR